MKLHSTATEALAFLQSGHRVFIQGAAATPNILIDAMLSRAPDVTDVEIFHLHTIGPARYADPMFRNHFRVSSFFVGANLRSRMCPGFVDYIPCFLSEIPSFFRSGRIPLDIALIHVSPPDQHGYCSLGVSVDAARAAVDMAKVVIAQINPQMPRVQGDGLIHVSRIDHAVEVNVGLPLVFSPPPTPEEIKIGEIAATLVENGSTLQTGIGAIPDAILGALKNHQHLGVHSEMWTNGTLELLEKGIIDNSQKKIHRGRSVAGFLMGSQKLYDFVNDNPSVVTLDIAYVNNPVNIARNPKVVAINSAIEIDLTGQICADSVGPRIISGAGGQIDFIRGASLSEGGKPIIALTSRSKQGFSRLVPTLNTGAGVVTTRAHVHYVVTEYGIADLYGKTLAQRAKALIAIAHPEDAEGLSSSWKNIYRGMDC